MLAYDLVSNEAEWIPEQGMVSDLSQVEEASARELSNMVLHNLDAGVRRLDQFREQRSKSVEEGAEKSGAKDNINDNDGTKEGTEEAPCEERQEMNQWIKAMKGTQIETLMRRVTAQIPPWMAHIPWHPARGACTPCTATPQDATQVVAAGQTSASLRIEVT